MKGTTLEVAVQATALPLRRLLGRYDYPTSHRVFELASLATLLGLGGALAWSVGREVGQRFSPVVAALVVGLLVAGYGIADLLSGLVHFLFDTVGSPDTPIIGQKFIKPFRDHHDDPAAMTRRDFVAVNADNFFVCLPVLVPAVVFLDVENHPYVATLILALVLPVLFTNQIHKWTHVPMAPSWVRFLQSRGLVLSNEHHAVHHAEPRNRNYCITWGAMDHVLNRYVARRG